MCGRRNVFSLQSVEKRKYACKSIRKKGIRRTRRPDFPDSGPDLQRNSYIEVLALRIGKLRTKESALEYN